MTTGLVTHESYFWHDTGSGWILPADATSLQPLGHPENAETKRRLLNLLTRSGLLDQLQVIEPRAAEVTDLELVHTPEHIEAIRALSASGGGDAGGLTPIGNGSYEIALMSTGGCLAAADAVVDGAVDNAYALVRPPGHHALADSALGFCLFNNAAIVARHLQQRRGIERVAIVDWDVHHGNGQQAIFYDDPTVLTVSVHQDSCFPPDSGHVGDTGEGAGVGFNINVPLPPGSGHGAYVAAWEQAVIPALHAFEPDFIIVASGFDGGIFDPLGRQMAYNETFRALAQMTKAAAGELCDGRLLATHEGGYSAAYVPFLGLAVVEELSGIDSGVSDPYLPIAEGNGQQDLQPHQAALIEQASRLPPSPAG